MRPKSLRDEMATWPESEQFRGIDKELLAKIEAGRAAAGSENQFRASQPPNALVKSLLQEQHVKLRRYRKRGTETPDIEQLKHAIELGLVLVTFTGTKVRRFKPLSVPIANHSHTHTLAHTQGETELGANLRDDSGAVDARNATWSADGKTLSVSGRLRLDYCPVRLEASIDAATFEGRGKLTVIAPFASNTTSGSSSSSSNNNKNNNNSGNNKSSSSNENA